MSTDLIRQNRHQGTWNHEPKRIADMSNVIPELAPVPLKPAATLSNLWGTWIGSRQLAPNSLEAYRFEGKRILAFFREREMNVQSILDWCKYLRTVKNHKGGPLSAKSIHLTNSTLRSFLKFIQKLGFLKHNLWEFVELPKLPESKPPELVTEAEYQALKAHLKNSDRYQWALWMIILGYRTGMTMCDCANLRWEQVFLNDTAESYMDVPRQKMRRHGIVCRIPIVPNSDLHEWLLKLQSTRHLNYKRFDGLNFVHQDCPGYHAGRGRHYMTEDFARLFAQAGLKGKSFASLRRTFISNLVNSGMQYALICKITGHTNIKTLLGYLRPDRKALRDGVMKAQQYAEGAKPN